MKLTLVLRIKSKSLWTTLKDSDNFWEMKRYFFFYLDQKQICGFDGESTILCL